MKIYLDFLGCKLNQAEAERISYGILQCGYSLAVDIKDADVYILNSCAVTAEAERKTRNKLAASVRKNTRIIRILIGCCGQKDKDEYLRQNLAEYVLGNDNKYSIYQILQTLLPYEFTKKEPENVGALKRIRSFVQIQEGCHNFCSYCIVPYLRTNENSTSVIDIIDTINHRLQKGYGEVTLTGTEIGSYSSQGYDLTALVKVILHKTEVKRLRLSSLQPQEISLELLQLFAANHRLCHHFHISLQSASPAILKYMNRPYTLEEYNDALERIWGMLPDAAVTTDVIVGFPGESELDFALTLDFCQKTPFAKIHAFPYSSRKITAAASMSAQVSELSKRERMFRLLNLAKDKMQEFALKHIGQVAPVYVEGQYNGLYEGYTSNYLRVFFTASSDLSGKIVDIKINSLMPSGEGAIGELADKRYF
ncbi:MAG: MiaB/RimO family radical SAM methylthiotransferase [Chloroflexi bacterium]|nr:MiaB/RimO family radical SAM methylthiotransferase [Chloroflexota bacterium]